MKRSHIHLIFTVIGVLATIGCSRISEPSFVSEYALTVTASFEQETSKSTLLDGGKTIYWEPNDEIKVFCGQESGRLVSTNVENSTTATFTGTISGGIRPFEKSELYALYPYREDALFEDGVVTTTLPEKQIAVKGTFDREANIVMAVSDSKDLKFKNVCGGLKFTLTKADVKRIEFESNGSEYLAGEISLKFDGVNPSVADVRKGCRKVTLEKKDGSAFEPGEWYYITLLPCTLSDGYTVTISTDTKSAVLFVEKEQVVKRNTYGVLKDIDAGLSWTEKELQESSFILQKGVKTMNKREVSSYVSCITQNGFNISGDAPASIIPNVGDVLFFETADASVPYMIGRVKDLVRTKSSGSTVITEEVGIEDVFQEFSIGEQITMLDVPEITDDDGNIYECGLASPGIWDELTRPLSDTSSVSTEVDSMPQKPVYSPAYAAANKTRVPKYLRIANHIFNGNFYFDIDLNYPEKITYKNGEFRFVIDVELRGGIRGDIGYHGEATIIDLISKKMKWKVGYIGSPIGGIPIFIRPVLQVYFKGNTTIHGDVQLELIHSSFTASNIPGRSKDYSPLPKDSYLTLKSFKADCSLGYKLGIGIENSIINENFLKLGIEVTGGTEGQIIGDFPSKDGKDLDKNLKFAHNGNINIAGYIEARINAFKPEKRLDFPIFSYTFKTVEVNLLPRINCISAKANSTSNTVSIAAVANRQCFISSSEGGYCIYKKGEKQPIEHKPMYVSASTKAYTRAASSNGLTFDIEKGKKYEIAPYAIVNEGEYVYGDKIPIKLFDDIDKDFLIKFYKSTNGEKWTINRNWCTDAPIDEWYGIECFADENGSTRIKIDLSVNNLTGDGDISGCPYLIGINVQGNEFSLNISGCRALTEFKGYVNYIKSLDISECTALTKLLIPYSDRLTSLNVSGCTALTKLDCSHCYNLKSLNLSKCIALTELDCNDDDKLSSLDISDCTSLKILFCGFCDGLSSLDLTACPSLIEVHCDVCGLTSLTVAGNTGLKKLHCTNNYKLSELNASGCSSLEDIEFGIVGYGNLKRVNFTNCYALRNLNLYLNGYKTITTLILKNCKSLTNLDICGFEKINHLDVSNCTSLKRIEAYDVPLSYLNVEGCTSLENLDVRGTHMNSVITDFIDNIKEFWHDPKYNYITDEYGRLISYTTNQYGWWYPGEPEKVVFH